MMVRQLGLKTTKDRRKETTERKRNKSKKKPTENEVGLAGQRDCDKENGEAVHWK